jgi:hypothetical protein
MGEILNQSASAVYTPPIARGGKTGMLSVDMLQVSSTSVTLTIDVEHKNLSDTTWVSLTSFTNLTAVSMGTVQANDLKEQVRLKFTLNGASTDWVRVFILPVSWMD